MLIRKKINAQRVSYKLFRDMFSKTCRSIMNRNYTIVQLILKACSKDIDKSY